jgi:hypothetical protein
MRFLLRSSLYGGLLLHSFLVYKKLVKKMQEYYGKIELEDLEKAMVIGCLHDLCKTSFYVKKVKPVVIRTETYRQGGQDVEKKIWGNKEVYQVEDTIPMGHGEKSVYMIQEFMKLTLEEALAIRWHLGGFLPGVHFNYPEGNAYYAAITKYPLVAMVVSADFEVSQILGV